MKINQGDIIKEIAEELDCGNNCYYNSKTNEIVTIPNFSDTSDEQELKEFFRDDLNKINNQKANYIKVEVLKSFESFKIMEHFSNQIIDKKFKLILKDILENKKPFQNFKNAVDNSEFRQEWFDFKHNEIEKIVEVQLKGKLTNDY
ncbi:UPF0158 family protein [Maribacter sp. Asnod2-G09]|uniref:UPF0158 family protein n=1 Tax=Maribacter sp. Asnod2-G09 TaxID=3160577 RepID=UPI00386A562D